MDSFQNYCRSFFDDFRFRHHLSTVSWVKYCSMKDRPAIKGTIQPCFRLVLSGNVFLALDRSHHVLKSVFNKTTWAQWFTFDNFTLLKNNENRCKVIKFESLGLTCHIKFWLFLTKNDDFYLKTKRNSRMAGAWDQADLSPCLFWKRNNNKNFGWYLLFTV